MYFDTAVKSDYELYKTLVSHFKLTLAAVREYSKGTFDLDMAEHFDRQKSEVIRK